MRYFYFIVAGVGGVRRRRRRRFFVFPFRVYDRAIPQSPCFPCPHPRVCSLASCTSFPHPERKPNRAARRAGTYDIVTGLMTVPITFYLSGEVGGRRRRQKATPVEFLRPGTDDVCFPTWTCPDRPRARSPSPLDGRSSVVKGGVHPRCGTPGPRSGRRRRKRGDVMAP